MLQVPPQPLAGQQRWLQQQQQQVQSGLAKKLRWLQQHPKQTPVWLRPKPCNPP